MKSYLLLIDLSTTIPRGLIGVLTALLVALSPLPASAGFTLLDDFNRGNSVSLGSNWTAAAPLTGTLGINGGRAAPKSSVPGTFLYNPATSSSIEMDIFASSGQGITQAGAVLGFQNTNANITVLFQGDSTFDTFGFYYGGSGTMINLNTVFNAARIILSLSGTTATLSIDAGFTGTFSQVYTRDFTAGQVASLGTGVGITANAGGSIDNFGIVSPSAVPEPSSLALCGIAGLTGLGIAWKRRKRAA